MGEVAPVRLSEIAAATQWGDGVVHCLNPYVRLNYFAKLVALCAHMSATHTPVSYTHLDVYKRQVEIHPVVTLNPSICN